MTAPVSIKSVSHSFGDFQALTDVSLEIGSGEYVTLLGPSGCGKTTLLSVLGGFIDPTTGEVLIDGRDMTRVAPAKRPTTTMFQDYALFPHMSLRDNVAFGLRMAGMGRAARYAVAHEMLDLVGLEHAAATRPHALSGGQRQRVALARALAVKPDVLLLDEPLGALDLKLRRAMQDELKSIQRRVGTTFVHVTHDQEEAMAIADRIVVMNAGRIEDEGPPARIYRAPATLFAADFMGEMNHFPARSDGASVTTAFGALPGLQMAPGEAVLCIRPEAMRTGDGALSFGPGKVAASAFFGTHTRVQVVPEAAPDLVLTAHLPPSEMPEAGNRLTLSADASAFSLFPAGD
ncbi:ABC transporter ATP-binding protein [Roseobacter ponti]|uniref:ABC transporter ATP-binding protein n=1 Tax=Roseobacter ponti TaxID=1891787 RepID=A0A858SV98_9RHOB|nr:ABC transporter ATP-binding protein [Roseobacter ponti]